MLNLTLVHNVTVTCSVNNISYPLDQIIFCDLGYNEYCFIVQDDETKLYFIEQVISGNNAMTDLTTYTNFCGYDFNNIGHAVEWIIAGCNYNVECDGSGVWDGE